MILIIGAGIAGLSAAFHLSGKDYVLLEKDDEVGGLCRSKELDGFFFDYTGHLLHTRDRYFSSFIDEHFPGTFLEHERRSFVFSHDVYTPYPFQMNTFGLPEDVVYECVSGFLQARMTERKDASTAPHNEERSFKEWILAEFGKGFARYFLFPFNEKLYCRDLDEMSSEWTGWSVPVPDVSDVVAGAIGIRKRGVGYNPTFLYPVEGGIDVLPRGMASLCRYIHCGCEIDCIDLQRKEARIRNGGSVRYDAMISTISLPRLLSICKDLPDELRTWGRSLTSVKVIDINLGFEGNPSHDFHWIYFPEKKFPFYRVGFPTNFSKGVAPAGCSSLYAEVSLRSDDGRDAQEVVRNVIHSLVALKIISGEEAIIIRDVNIIDPAYVVFDFSRKMNRTKIISNLKKAGVIVAGRFGTWDYLSMEGSFLDGRRAALEVLEL